MPQAEQPPLTGLEWLWNAWNDLNTCRYIGMDVGPIPWSSVDSYARRHFLTETEFDLLWHCVRHLERVYRGHVENERKRKDHGRHSKERKARR